MRYEIFYIFSAALDMDSCPLDSPHEAVLIDTLLSEEQYRGPDRSTGSADGKPTKDIAEVSRATDLILPKGSARTTPTVSFLTLMVINITVDTLENILLAVRLKIFCFSFVIKV